MSKEMIPIERIAQRVRHLRGEKVFLDFDLAQLYGVSTGNLNKASIVATRRLLSTTS